MRPPGPAWYADAMPRILTAVVLVLLLVPVAGAKKPKPPVCPDGRFIVDDPTVGGVTLGGGLLSLDAGCAPAKAKVKSKRSATVVVAKWRSCEGGVKKARLVGRI